MALGEGLRGVGVEATKGNQRTKKKSLGNVSELHDTNKGRVVEQDRSVPADRQHNLKEVECILIRSAAFDLSACGHLDPLQKEANRHPDADLTHT